MTTVADPGPSRSTLVHEAIGLVGNSLLRPPLGGFGRVHTHGPRSTRRVAITFDDGPNEPATSDVLDVLKQHGAKATFFCVGINALRYPDTVRRAYHEGHVIANHSMLHRRKSGLMPTDDGHIDECEDVLSELLGVRPALYRAPWGWVSPWETRRLLERQFEIIGWDVDTDDWKRPSPSGERIAERIRDKVRPGSIVLFHDGLAGWFELEKPDTARGLDLALSALSREGLECVTVSELLGVPAYR